MLSNSPSKPLDSACVRYQINITAYFAISLLSFLLDIEQIGGLVFPRV